MTPATDFPTVNPVQTDLPGFDAFVAKISADGQTLLYATYLGGAGSDEGHGIAVVAEGAAYVAGKTSSGDFPTLNPFQGYRGVSDAFVVKLSPAGQLAYATYLGGSEDERGHGVAADAAGNAYVTGETGSSDFPTLAPWQATYGGFISDAFVVQIDDRDYLFLPLVSRE